MDGKSSRSRSSSPIPIEEMIALIRYASERGLDPENRIVGPLYLGICQYNAEQLESGAKKCEEESEFVRCYGELSKITQPVTGRTLLDTKKLTFHLRLLFVYTFMFLVLAIGNEVLNQWLDDIVEPEEGWLAWFIDFHRYAIDYLSPFFWGGLGACVFLLKRLTDLAAARTFEQAQLQGWQTRILLGAILGAVVQYIYDPASFTENAMRLDAKAVAFLTGIGIKVVYGAIEKTIEVLGEKLNLSAVRHDVEQNAAVRKYLSQQLSEADPAKDQTKRGVIIAMIDKLERPDAA